MSTPRQQRIIELEQKLAALKAKMRAEEARQRAAQSKVERARDTRRKVLVGAFLLDQLGRDGAAQLVVQGRAFSSWVSRPDDRALFDLPPSSSAPGSGAAP